MTQFCFILLDDLAVIGRRDQAMLCMHVMPYHKHALILAENIFLYAAYSPRKDFELILMVKRKLDIPHGDHLVVSFRHL